MIIMIWTRNLWSKYDRLVSIFSLHGIAGIGRWNWFELYCTMIIGLQKNIFPLIF